MQVLLQTFTFNITFEIVANKGIQICNYLPT